MPKKIVFEDSAERIVDITTAMKKQLIDGYMKGTSVSECC